VGPNIVSDTIDALLGAVNERTRIVVVNSPHNPSGTIASADDLAELGARLEEINGGRRRPVWLLSDDREIVYSDGRFEPPLRHVRRSAICYSYGKRLLTPGQRVGYFAVNPAARLRGPGRRLLRANGDGMELSECADAVRASGLGKARHRRQSAREATRPALRRP
jgi:aspartate/methionine/tyrosine aminotransferase